MSRSVVVTRSGVDVGRADAMAMTPAKAVENFIVEIWATSTGATKVKNEETRIAADQVSSFQSFQGRVEVSFEIDSDALEFGRGFCNELANQEFVFP